MDKQIDAKLVMDYKAGNSKALAELVKRWHKSFCNKAYWIVKDPDLAKDIAQDSWTVIIHRINALRDEKSFGSWALRIVYSRSLDELRKHSKKRQKHENYVLEYESVSSVGVEEESIALKYLLIKSIKQLPEHQKVVIRLFYVEDYSLKDISEILNISVGTAKSRLFHAREKLKRILNKRKS